MPATKMNWFSILFYHFLLIDITLALALAGNKNDLKESHATGTTATKTTMTTTSPATTSTTELPAKASTGAPKSEKPDVHFKSTETVEKPLPKKRGVLEDLYRSQPVAVDDNGFDVNDESIPEELYSASRSEMEERPVFSYGEGRDTGFVNEDGYFENDGRIKRTTMFQAYNRPQEYSNPEFELTPDEVMTLLTLLEERRLYNNPPQGFWSDDDNTVDSIEADMRDEDTYRPRAASRFDLYQGNFDNLGRYPTGMKRYMITRRRRSNFLGNPKLKVPVLRRAVL